MTCCSFLQNSKKSELKWVQCSKNSCGGLHVAEGLTLKYLHRLKYLSNKLKKMTTQFMNTIGHSKCTDNFTTVGFNNG